MPRTAITGTQLRTAARATLLARKARLARLEIDTERDHHALVSERNLEERALAEEIADVLLRLTERERRELREIDAALVRIEHGEWGRCEWCGDMISPARLDAMPEARFCVNCAQ